jgi:hypothetical protein
MGLVKKSEGKGTSVQLRKVIADRVQAFADGGGYTLKSVVETALEEFLERQAPEADEIEDREPAPPLGVKLSPSQKAMRDRGES